jgi:hypothetical protein
LQSVKAWRLPKHLKALLPGVEFRLSEGSADRRGELILGAELRLGQTTNLGNVRMMGKVQ